MYKIEKIQFDFVLISNMESNTQIENGAKKPHELCVHSAI